MKQLHKGIASMAAIVTIVTGVFAAWRYNQTETQPVQADRGSVAVGGNVEGDVKLNAYDYDAGMREKAESYVTVATGTCKETLASVESLTPDSNPNLMEVVFTVPPSLQMTEEAAAHYGSDAANEVQSRIQALGEVSADFNNIYTQRNVQDMIAKNMVSNVPASVIEQLKESNRARDAQARASFDTKKKTLLDSISGLCHYIQLMRPAGKAS